MSFSDGIKLQNEMIDMEDHGYLAHLACQEANYLREVISDRVSHGRAPIAVALGAIMAGAATAATQCKPDRIDTLTEQLTSLLKRGIDAGVALLKEVESGREGPSFEEGKAS